MFVLLLHFKFLSKVLWRSVFSFVLYIHTHTPTKYHLFLSLVQQNLKYLLSCLYRTKVPILDLYHYTATLCFLSETLHYIDCLLITTTSSLEYEQRLCPISFITVSSSLAALLTHNRYSLNIYSAVNNLK